MFGQLLKKISLAVTSAHSFADKLDHWPNARPVTSLRGPFEQSPAVRDILAIYKDGRVLVAKSQENKPSVQNVLHKAKKYGLALQMPISVEPTQIKASYEGFQNNLLSDKDASRMRQLLFHILEEAAKINASDVQVRVEEFGTRITCRKNGKIQRLRDDLPPETGMTFSTAIFNACDARSSGTNHQEERFQSGAISGQENFRLPKPLNSCRLQFNPIAGRGRDIAIRLFYNTAASQASDLSELGYNKTEIEIFKRAMAKPFGLIAIAGTTGSGKSTALQRILNWLNIISNRSRRIITVEDPVEYPMPGIIQMPVRDDPENRGAAFNAAIRAMLRSDPDVIMISELRDAESAGMAFQAVMTGHPTYATLHVTRAIDIATRLIEDFAISKTKVTNHRNISLLVAQMLVRVLCPRCKLPLGNHSLGDNPLGVLECADEHAEPVTGDPVTGDPIIGDPIIGDPVTDGLRRRLEALGADLSNVSIHNPAGCKDCDYQGIKGRTVIAEFIEPDEIFMTHIRGNLLEDARKHWLAELGGKTIEEKMISKVLSGEIDPRDAEQNIGPLSPSMLNSRQDPQKVKCPNPDVRNSQPQKIVKLAPSRQAPSRQAPMGSTSQKPAPLGQTSLESAPMGPEEEL